MSQNATTAVWEKSPFISDFVNLNYTPNALACALVIIPFLFYPLAEKVVHHLKEETCEGDYAENDFSGDVDCREEGIEEEGDSSIILTKETANQFAMNFL